MRFPVRLSFAGTVQKAHGQNLLKVVVDLRSNHSPGELYLAVLRVRNSGNIILIRNTKDTHDTSNADIVREPCVEGGGKVCRRDELSIALVTVW